MNKSDAILVSFDYGHGDTALLIVGRKGVGESVQIINAFSGKEAEELYKKIVTPKERKYVADKKADHHKNKLA